jgi:hypothetical protein
MRALLYTHMLTAFGKRESISCWKEEDFPRADSNCGYGKSFKILKKKGRSLLTMNKVHCGPA